MTARISQAVLGLFCCFCCSAVFYLAAALVKGRVAGVEILAVQMLLRNAEGISEALIVNYLTLAEKSYGIENVGVIGQTYDIIICHASLLLCRKVFVQVCDYVALDSHVFHIKRYSRCGGRVNSCRMVDKVRRKRCSDQIVLQISNIRM